MPGPPNTPPPEPGVPLVEDGEYARDETPCQQELGILKTFMRNYGEALILSARNNARDARDLQTIRDRMKELQAACPQGDAGTNSPWDHDGHGTIVAGLIAATTRCDEAAVRNSGTS